MAFNLSSVVNEEFKMMGLSLRGDAMSSVVAFLERAPASAPAAAVASAAAVAPPTAATATFARELAATRQPPAAPIAPVPKAAAKRPASGGVSQAPISKFFKPAQQ